MENEYQKWMERPGPQTMGELLTAAQPTINSAIQSYAGGNKALSGTAKAMAIKAFQTYDPAKGAKLQTHLMNQLQPLTRESRKWTQVSHVPERASTDLYSVNQHFQSYFDQYGREPSDKELADMTGLSVRRIAQVRGYGKGELAESALTEMDEGEEAVYYPGVARADPQQVWMEYVHHDLDPIDQKILEWKTGYNGKKVISTNEIARRLGISASAVSQRAKKIADRMAEGETMEV